ncbi:MAG: M23 family metallopeptidase [Bacteroidales bacterium]|nr:M23 family metallopeptidase [Bacteroidales bacterium]
MPKYKYKFNPESLNYDKIEKTSKQKFFQAFSYILASIFLAVIIILIFSYFFDTPKEKSLKRENKQLIVQYNIMDKKLAQISNVLSDIQQRDDNIYRVIFEADPIPRSVREAGFGGVNRYAKLEGYSNSDLVIETATKLDKISKKLYVQSKSYDKIIDMAKNKQKYFSCIPAIAPISDKDLIRFASGFGYRIHPIYKTRKMHTGIDLTAPTGTKIYATGDGKVIKSGISKGGYGKRVIINHNFGYKTVYAHLNKIVVRAGQKINRGELIGFVGSTGVSTAPHLHYEVRRNNKPVNPVNYYFNDITPSEYDKMILVSSRKNQSFD